MPDAPNSPSADEPDTERSEEASDNGPDLPTDPETLQRWVRMCIRDFISVKEARDCAQRENKQLKHMLEYMREKLERAPMHPSRAELLADELKQENERLRSELKELKQANASDHEADQAARMIAKIAEAARRGRTWESGAELMRWVSDHDQFLVSPRTVQRRLDTAGVWERTKRGQTRGGVRKTVKNCIQEAGRFNSDVVD